MGRPKRAAKGGLIYHVLNRANARMTIFTDDGDYEAMERVLAEAVERSGIRLLSYCLMPSHWHLVVWPKRDGQLSEFAGWLTLTHTQRWHANRQSAGTGHVYQGRFKSFPVQDDNHFLTVCRYVERNPVKANLVKYAQAWRFSSLYRWHAGTDSEKQVLSRWPVARRPGWLNHVNRPVTDSEHKALLRSIQRGCPFGDENWSVRKVKQLGLESTIVPRGRPKRK